MSPLTLGLLALLAYRTYQGKGRLAEMLGRDEPGGASAGTVRPGGRVTGPGRLPDGNPAGPLGREGGGLGNILRDIMTGGPGARQAGGTGGGIGDLLRGGLGGLLGGAATGSVLNGGLGDLLQRMQQSGYGDRAESWIGRGPNREIMPQDLESALGRDTVQELADQSGRPYMDVLSELSQSLPDAVDQLTPEGRMPTDDEANRWL
jgi:uncharacterized protein YidB (DUF937 family)